MAISSERIIQAKPNDYWIKEGRDLGVLIVDKTDLNSREWDSSEISQEGGAVIAGNNASTLTFSDGDYYNVRDTSSPNFDLNITPVIDGVALDDTNQLRSLEVQYSFRLKINAGPAWIKPTIYLQILKDTTWKTLATIYGEKYSGTYTSGWQIGVPITVDGGNGAQWVSGYKTTAELSGYFNKTGATYSSLKGMRFALRGQGDISGSAEIHVDFIKVRVGYMADDTSPIMEKITDSAESTLTCSSISAWTEAGVSENDGFKIAQNTRVIAQDIASEAGIYIKAHQETYTCILRPDQDGANNDWTLSGYERVDEVTPDLSIIFATLADSGEYEEFGFPNDVVLADNEIVTEVKVYTYGKTLGEDSPFRVDIYYNGAWQGEQATSFDEGEAYAWEYHTFIIADGTVDPDDLQVRYRSYTGSEDGEIWINTCYVKVTVEFQYPFTKYMGRNFRGSYCIEPLRAICKLEGAHWYEDYPNDRIVVLKPGAFVDSGVDLTEADYGHDWTFEDDCNQVKSFYVFGNAEDEIFARAVDETVEGYLSKQLIDETISTTADAQLALLNSKRPSIRLPLDGVRATLQLGKTVDVTLARPTLAKANHIIRKIERSSKGISGIKTVIYCGLGESPIEEKIAKIIRDNAFRSHKALTDRLSSP